MATRKRRGTTRPPVPLAYRLPNPPAVWVGRDRDVEWLAGAIERAPVSLVGGPGGVGKTALVLQTLHARFPRMLDRTIFLDVPTGEPAAQVRQDIVRALAKASGVADVDWAELQSDPLAATGAAIELAEAGGFFVVLDDVYQGDADETNEMLVQLASYARKSRFVATSRLTPRLPSLAGQVLTLEGMSDAELLELARAWAPNADAATMRRALTAASGSPWLLHQCLLAGASASLEDQGLLGGLAEDAAAFLRALALVEVPLPLPVLSLFAPSPGDDALAALEQRGLVNRAADGYRLHDVARGMLLGPRGEIDEKAASYAAAVLAQHELPEAQLESARLFVHLGRFDALALLLDDHAETLISEGYAPRLFRFIKDVADPRVSTWQLRCAAELGNPTALAQVRAPANRDAAETLAWARTLRANGDIEDALAQTHKVLEADAPSSVRSEALLFLATCLRHEGRYTDADEALAQLDEGRVSVPPGAADASEAKEALALTRDAARALGRVLAGHDARAELLALKNRAHRRPAASEAARTLAEAFYESAMLTDAAEMAELARPNTARPVLLAQREAILTSARITLALGRLTETQSLANEVRAFARGSSVLLPTLHVVDLGRRLAAGELDGLDPLLASCAAEVEGIDARCDLELATLRTRLATLHATDSFLADTPRGSTSSEQRAQEALALRRARREGRADAELESFLARDTHHPIAEAHRALVRASLALSEGDAALATTRASEAQRIAARRELAEHDAEARLALCDALLCADRLADLATEAAHLEDLARRLGSARFAWEARLFADAAKGGVPPGSLERLASLEHVAPIAARRAQAMLGGSPSLDHVDLRVLEALALGPGYASFERIDEAPPTPDERWAPGWGIDDRTFAVWLPDGRAIDLGGRTLAYKILAAIADLRGAATKEQLVLAAWEEREYHPQRHDGRLHVAIRKLRELIEEDVAAPRRLLTTDTGYRLAGPVRRAT